MLPIVIAAIMVAGMFMFAACGNDNAALERRLYELERELEELRNRPPATNGADGMHGTDGATWHTGANSPSATLGQNGDLFLNTTTNYVYRRSAQGQWQRIANIGGQDGEHGEHGMHWLFGTSDPEIPLGRAGDLFLNTITFDVFSRGPGGWDFTGNIRGGDGTQGIDGTRWFVGTDFPDLAQGARNGDLFMHSQNQVIYVRRNDNWVLLSETDNGSTTPGPQETIIISTPADLELLRTNLSGTFRLETNVTSIANHTPIGTPDAPFTGKIYTEIDSFGVPLYSIANVSITNTIASGNTHLAGLFGVFTGTIENFVIENLEIDFNNLPNNANIYIGGIAGISYGTIKDVQIQKVTANVASNYGNVAVGAIAGKISGNNAIIQNTTVEGQMQLNIGDVDNRSDNHSRIAGIVGIIEFGATVYRVISDVEVDAVVVGRINTTVAGIAGFIYNGGNILSSINWTTVEILGANGTVYAGGIVGNIQTERPAPSGTSADFRWTVNILNNFARGGAIATNSHNAYVSAAVARISDDSGGAASDITIRNLVTMGSSIINALPNMSPGDNNRTVGSVLGRVRALASSIITIENVLVVEGGVRGDVAALVAGNSPSAGIIVGRAQDPASHNFNNLMFSTSVTLVGHSHLNQSVPRTALPGVPVTDTQIFSAAWQAANTNFDPGVWTFLDDHPPALTWWLDMLY